MSKPSELDWLLARLAVGFHGPLNYYKTLMLLGYDWAEPVVAALQIKHNDAIDALNAYRKGVTDGRS